MLVSRRRDCLRWFLGHEMADGGPRRHPRRRSSAIYEWNVKARRLPDAKPSRGLKGNSVDAAADATQWTHVEAAARDGNAGLQREPRPAMRESRLATTDVVLTGKSNQPNRSYRSD